MFVLVVVDVRCVLVVRWGLVGGVIVLGGGGGGGGGFRKIVNCYC